MRSDQKVKGKTRYDNARNPVQLVKLHAGVGTRDGTWEWIISAESANIYCFNFLPFMYLTSLFDPARCGGSGPDAAPFSLLLPRLRSRFENWSATERKFKKGL